MITSDIKQKRTLAGIKTITDNEIKEMQMFYDSGKTTARISGSHSVRI